MRLMSMWLLGRYVASTVILVPESFGGCWPRRCGQLRGDKERPFSGVTSSGRWAISGVSLLPPSFVVCQFSFTRRRRIVESACVLLFRCFLSYWWVHFPGSVPFYWILAEFGGRYRKAMLWVCLPRCTLYRAVAGLFHMTPFRGILPLKPEHSPLTPLPEGVNYSVSLVRN